MAKKNNKLSDKPWLVVLLHGVVAVAAGLILFFGVKVFLNLYTRHAEEIVVPDFSNLTIPEAQALADEHYMRVEVTDSVFLKRMRKGVVCRQSPAPGSMVKKEKLITLTINAKNAKTVTMPDLVGLSMRQAKAELLSRGLGLQKLTYVKDLATNNVLKQLYKGREIEDGEVLESGSQVELVVGLNNSDFKTYVPDATGFRQMTAVNAMYDNSLNVNSLRFDETVKDYDDSLNAMVWKQVPAASDSISVQMGAGVTLYLTLDENKIPKKEAAHEN